MRTWFLTTSARRRSPPRTTRNARSSITRLGCFRTSTTARQPQSATPRSMQSSPPRSHPRAHVKRPRRRRVTLEAWCPIARTAVPTPLQLRCFVPGARGRTLQTLTCTQSSTTTAAHAAPVVSEWARGRNVRSANSAGFSSLTAITVRTTADHKRRNFRHSARRRRRVHRLRRRRHPAHLLHRQAHRHLPSPRYP